MVACLILLGSEARGDAATDSDVDVLAVLQDNVNTFNEISQMGRN